LRGLANPAAAAGARAQPEGRRFYCRADREVKPLGRDRDSWSDKRSFAETQGYRHAAACAADIWESARLEPLRVGVALTAWWPKKSTNPTCSTPKNTKLVQAIDAVNEKFGRRPHLRRARRPDQQDCSKGAEGEEF